MICSLARREATPASAKNFCNRTNMRKKRFAAGGDCNRTPPKKRPNQVDGPRKLGVWLGFAQPSHSITRFPLTPSFQDLDPFKAFENVPFRSRSAGSAQATML